MPGEGDAQTSGAARARRRAQSARHECNHLVETRPRQHEAGMFVVEVEKKMLIARETEKIVLLARALERMSVRTLRVGDFLVGEVRLIIRAIPTLEFAEVDVVGVALEHSADDLVHADAMTRLGRADEIVVADV